MPRPETPVSGPVAMSLAARLTDLLAPWRAAPAWRVAFSGGLDSTVLLHLLASHPLRRQWPPLSAIHVHHGLQAEADAWVMHCRERCQQWQVPLQVCHVQVAAAASLERQAREARYAAFREHLGAGELLLLAQHRDDQAETLMLRLLRGAGSRGLGGMPFSRALGGGQLARPLLGVSRDELEAYADAQGLHWIEDPSNRDQRFERNRLRQSILPALRQHWPQADERLAAAATQLTEDAVLLDELAQQDLQAADQPSPFDWLEIDSLALAPLRELSEARQRNALRHWLASRTLLPDRRHWAGWQALRDAAEDAAPVWRLAAGSLRRAAGRLWWLPQGWDAQTPQACLWSDPRQSLRLPGNGELSWSGAPIRQLRVAYRQGGEQVYLPGRGHRDLKRLLNESGIPVFLRPRLPLLYDGEQLLAVANLCVAGDAPAPHWRFSTSSKV